MITTELYKKMAEALKDFFKDYNGCRNCKYQPQPLQMCKDRWNRKAVELICQGWEKRDENGSISGD